MKVGVLCGDLSMRGGGIPSAILPLYGELVRQEGIGVLLLGQNPGSLRGMSDLPALDLGGAGRFGYATGLDRRLDAQEFDVLHTHGLWTYASVLAARWGRRHRKPVVVSPHGMLDPWALAQSKWKKKIARVLFEGRHIDGAACLHALNDSEAAASRAWGFSGPIAVIPNGIAIPSASSAPRSRAGAGQGRTLLFLGRIAAKKGIRELLQSWSLLKAEGRLAGWKLAIAGWGDARYEAAVRALADELRLGETATFLGPKTGAEKTATYAHADAFILPSHSEGMPMTVLEAWSFGLPVLMTRACNLPVGFERGAAVEIEPSPAALAAAIAAFIERSDRERSAMGSAGRTLVAEGFTWQAAAARLGAVYRWLLSGGHRPDCVSLLDHARGEVREARGVAGHRAAQAAQAGGG
jgi:poly(glycerol-phosphate) alpha-glucosyltransferase